MIAAEGLTKRYGPTTAVDDLSFEVHSGQVTGFLGPNGAGKSTTLRMVLGLDRPDSGTVTVDGQHYGALRRPLYDVGAMLEGKAVRGVRRAEDEARAFLVDVTDGNLPVPGSALVDFTGTTTSCVAATPMAAPGFSVTPWSNGFFAQNFFYGNVNWGGDGWQDLFIPATTSVYRVRMNVGGNRLGYMH